MNNYQRACINHASLLLCADDSCFLVSALQKQYSMQCHLAMPFCNARKTTHLEATPLANQQGTVITISYVEHLISVKHPFRSPYFLHRPSPPFLSQYAL
jgi:hypothetical protein